MARSNDWDLDVEHSPVVQAIRAHEWSVLHHRVRPELSQCPRCEHRVDASTFFRLHEIRRRTFWVLVCATVHTIVSCISRWKCSHCGRTFTWYPAFAMRHKRYVLPLILERSQAYVEQEDQSYRQGVREQGEPIFHARSEDEEITAASSEQAKTQERVLALAHSTLHRWVSTVGALGQTLRRAWRLIQQACPARGLVRELAGFRVAPGKYRSPARQGVLHACRCLCVTEGVYAAIFGVSIFPNLATACRWT